MKRPLFWIGIVFLSAMAVFLTFSRASAALLAVIIALSAAFLCRPQFKPKTFALLLCAAALGAAWQMGYEHLKQDRLANIKADSGESILINATLTENVAYSGWQSVNVRADVYTSALGNPVTDDFPLYGVFTADLSAGDVLHCTAKFVKGRFTVERYDISDKVLHPLLSLRLRTQAAVSNKIDALFSGDDHGIIKALLTGDRSSLDDEIISDFRKSSLSHVLVVSGMHLVIISNSLAKLLSKFLSKKKHALAVILFCWLFAALSGFGISIVRAAVMMTIMQSGMLIDRRGDTLTSLATAAIVIALPSPNVITSASFLLSFSAVAGLSLLQKPICSALYNERSNIVVKYIAESCSAAAAAQLATAPVCAVMFGSVSVIGIIANLAVVWLLQPIMAMGIISLILGCLHPVLAVPFIVVCKLLISLITFLARIFADIPFASLLFNERWQIGWLFGSALLLIILYCRFGFKGSGRFAALAITLIYAAGSLFSFSVGNNQADLLFFEQSRAVAIVKGGHAVMVGAPQNRWQLYNIQTAFDRMGVERLDAVLLQNSDNAGYHLAKLAKEYDCEAVICKNDRAADSFCGEIGADLYQYPTSDLLFGKSEISGDEHQVEIIFNNCKLLKNQDSCDIIGVYTLSLPIDGAERIKVEL